MRTLFSLLIFCLSLHSAEPPLKVGGWQVIAAPKEIGVKNKWVVEPLSEVEGQVTLETLTVPLRTITGIFGPKDEIQYADFPAGSVVVKAKNPGKCRVVLLTIDKDGFPERAVSKIITVDPLEPVPPGPDPVPPGPTPGPAPIPADGFRVLIVYEAQDVSKLPFAQAGILSAASIRDYLDAKCVAGPDGKTKEYRIWDQNVDTANVQPHWQAAMKRERKSVPWICISTGKGGYEGPLPADTAATLELLKKFGGN